MWQWDTGRKLTVDAACSQVQFIKKIFGRSIDVDVVDGVAIIPDILLQTDKDLNVWAFVGTAENGYTKISKTFRLIGETSLLIMCLRLLNKHLWKKLKKRLNI